MIRSGDNMDNDSLLEFYQYRLFKKLSNLQYTQRVEFMSDLFGKRAMEVYEQIILLYPQLSHQR